MRKHVLNIINLPRIICAHLYGEHHTHKHRMIIGVIIAIIGVVISKLGTIPSLHLLHIPADVLGYGIHGMGFVPFIDYYQSKGKQYEDFHCKTGKCDTKTKEDEKEDNEANN